MEITRTCTQCHCELDEHEGVELDDDLLCPACIQRYTTTCDHCGDTIWLTDSVSDERTTLCECCYDEHYRRCEGCGRILHEDDVLWHSDHPYCASCYDRLQTEIEEYNYKPEPIFYGDGSRFFGVELEIDYGGRDEDNASQIKKQTNIRSEHMYCKNDGSLDDGFEIVSHPATLDYHLGHMYWSDVLQEAIRLGYRSHMTNTCGLHIHVNRDAFGETPDEQEKVIERILFFTELHWNELFVFSRRSPHAMNRWAARYGIEKTGRQILDKAKKGSVGRYAAINLCPYRTIEFRLFRGTLKQNTLFATLQLVNRICDIALTMSEDEIAQLSWRDFVLTIQQQELIQYLKERRLYINEAIKTEEDL